MLSGTFSGHIKQTISLPTSHLAEGLSVSKLSFLKSWSIPMFSTSRYRSTLGLVSQLHSSCSSQNSIQSPAWRFESKHGQALIDPTAVNSALKLCHRAATALETALERSSWLTVVGPQRRRQVRTPALEARPPHASQALLG